MNHTVPISLLLGAIAAFCSPVGALGQTEGERPVDVKLCEVITHGERYDNKQLRVHASVDSDGMHTTLLTDRKCAAGILLYYSDEVEKSFAGHPDVQALERAIEEGRAGTLDKRIEGTFTGLFVLDRSKPTIRCLLKLEAVTDLKVSAKKSAR